MKIVETKWGHEKTIVNDRKYAGRLSFYKKDHASNFGCYRNQDKTYYVRQGEVEVRFGDSDRIHETLGRVYGTGDFFDYYSQMLATKESTENAAE